MTDAELARLRDASSYPIGDVGVEGGIVYASVSSVECVGLLLERATDRVHVLGSAVTLETYVWALGKGFALHAPNVLRVTAVHQHEQALELFRHAYTPRYVRDEIARLFVPSRMPARIQMDWPATALLVEPLRHTDAITYEVERS